MATLEESPIDQEQQADVGIIQKAKKPRSQAKIDATQKMLLAKSHKREQDLQIKREQEEKLKAEEERIQKKLEEKIIKKAINIKKKRQTKSELLDLIVEDDDETDSPSPVKMVLQKEKIIKKVLEKPIPIQPIPIQPKLIFL